jgi:hypothetical protein
VRAPLQSYNAFDVNYIRGQEKNLKVFNTGTKRDILYPSKLARR